ncbi:MAG TPA: type II toxin-antitoxin system HicB family antitoxin [Candidatus Hydrogenedentes bacterium]|nr:type II toxin-antitoxin system HicB family antitoxin [Candidatus Hydrogenedentota bacterium]
MRSYIIPIVVEADEDRWRAYVPELEARGAATWGYTREEAIRNIQEVAQMVIESLIEDGEPLPTSIRQNEQPAIAVTV